jgi:hypothetical protein
MQDVEKGRQGHLAPGRRMAYNAAAVLLAVLCVVGFMGARKMRMGVPTGSVKDVDSRTGAVSVDLGADDGVLKGIRFAIVGDDGRQVAVVIPADIYPAMFWSKPLDAAEAAKVMPGMEARWLMTPELSMLLSARRAGTPDAYRRFVRAYPSSGFIPQLVRVWPEEMLRSIDPEFYDAWKTYTREGFDNYIEKNPGSGFAAAAKAELAAMKADEDKKEQDQKEREKRAAEYEKEQKRQEEIRAKVLARQQQRNLEEMHGKLVNNSSQPVKFVFDPPSLMPPTIVKPGEEFEVSHPTGTYTYKVYAAPEQTDDQAPDLLPPAPTTFDGEDQGPQPLAEGTVDIMFDFWSVVYP